MSEMIERAARAAWERYRRAINRVVDEASSFANLPEQERELWYSIERAAVEVMRNPTLEMERFGALHWMARRTDGRHASVLVWESMIDEALR